jgi:hypothetical protein
MTEGISSSLSTYRSIVGTDPAVNVEVSEVCPAEKQWRLVSVSVVLVQGLTQEPQPILQIDDGTNIVYEALGAATKQGASTTQRYTWGVALTVATVGATPNIHSTAPLPEHLVLSPGWHIKTTTVGKGAATDYGAPSLYLIEHG